MTYKYIINHDFFSVIDTEQKAYLLGIIYSDGYLNPKLNTLTINLVEDDKPLLETLNRLVNLDRNLRFIKPRKDTHKIQYQMTVTSKQITSDLIKLGVTNNKSLTITYPNFIPENLEHHFMRGVFDGDGSVSIGKRLNPQFSLSGNEIFVSEYITQMYNLMNRVEKIKFYRRYKNGSISGSYQTGGRERISLIGKFLYKDATIFMKRKYDKIMYVSSLPRKRGLKNLEN